MGPVDDGADGIGHGRRTPPAERADHDIGTGHGLGNVRSACGISMDQVHAVACEPGIHVRAADQGDHAVASGYRLLDDVHSSAAVCSKDQDMGMVAQRRTPTVRPI